MGILSLSSRLFIIWKVKGHGLTSKRQSWPLPVIFHLIAFDSYWILIGIYLQMFSFIDFYKILAILFERLSCKILINLLSDAYGLFILLEYIGNIF